MRPQDRWHKTTPGPLCGKCNVRKEKTTRHGIGMRWAAVWPDPSSANGKAVKLFDTRDAAQAKLDEMADTIRSGRYVSASAGRVLFSALAEEWLSGRAALKDSSADKYRNDLRLHVIPVIGHRHVSDIGRMEIQRLINGLRSTKANSIAPLGDNSKRAIHAVVQMVFKYAVKNKVIAFDANPCIDIELPKKPIKVSKYLPTTALVGRIADEMPSRAYALVHLAAASGMRISEMLGLTRDRLVFNQDGTLTITIERQLDRKGTRARPVLKPPKTVNSIRTIKVDTNTAGAVQRHLMAFGIADGLVFRTRSGGQYRANHASRDLGEAVRAAGLGGTETPVTWHTFRHYHVSYLVSAGVSIKAISARLGHKDVSTTLNEYTWLWHSDETDILAALDERVAPQEAWSRPRLVESLGGAASV